MTTVEARPNRTPSAFARVRDWVRDAIRGYSDKDLGNYRAAASGRISDDSRKSYQETQLERASLLAGGAFFTRVSNDPSYTPQSIGVEYIHQEIDRVKALTPEQQDLEIIQDARRWLLDHKFPIPQS